MSVGALTCIPFFIIAGELMNASGVTEKLIDFIRAIVGPLRGGLAYVVVIVAMILSAILGSANAVAAILCAVVVPEMIKDGYPDDFSASLVCASGVLGPIIPPSTTFVYYSVLSGVSVSALFAGGTIPGILIGLSYIAIIRSRVKKYNMPRSIDHLDWRMIGKKFVSAIPALIVPFIMIFGILLGVFTPAESGAVAVAAAVVAGLIYRKFSLKILPKVFLRSVTTTAGIFIIIGFGNIIGWTMAADNVPTKIQNAVLGLTHNGYIIILMMFAILIVVGCAMEATAAQLIFTPVLTPLAMYAGMDPVQFGVWFCIMITIGLVTPPVGGQMYLAGIPPCKHDVTNGLKYMIKDVESKGVRILTNTKITKDDLAGYDAVIVAAGGSPIVPAFLRGADRLVTGEEVLDGKTSVGKNIVIVGGGPVGCEVADFVADPEITLSQTSRTVTIIEMLDLLEKNEFGAARSLLMQRLVKKRVHILTSTKVTSVNGNTVKCEGPDEEIVLKNVDTIIAALGTKQDNSTYEEILATGIPVEQVTDTVNIYTATSHARSAARAMYQRFK